jgi:hypothetical protein
MFGLVPLRCVDPNPAGRVDIGRTHDADLSRSHAAESLQFDHHPNLAGDVGFDGVNERVGHRPDRLRLPDVGPAPSKARDRFEAVMARRGDHFLPDGPLERSENVTNPFVDFAPAESGIDHGLADGLEAERPEFPGRGVAVEFAKGSEGQPDVHRLSRGLAILDVVTVRMLQIRQEHFVDGGIRPGGRLRHDRPTAGRQPFGHEAVILGPALGSAELPEIEIPAADRDDGQAGGLMESVGRQTGMLDRHRTAPNPVDYRLSWVSKWAALSDRQVS